MPAAGFFGPLTVPQRPAVPAIDEDELENARKRQAEEDQHEQQNGPAKRAKLSNGIENDSEPPPPKSPMAMDVDEEPQNGNGNAYPSPEQLPSPVAPTFGPEKGIQVDKVSDLTAETTFLDLSDGLSSSSRNTVLLHCEFNPYDPTLLAAAGTDALARMWTLSRTPVPGSDVKMENGSPPPPYINLLDANLPSNTTTTCLAWASDGSCIAFATEGITNDSARVQVKGVDGTLFASLEPFCAPIVLLRWNLSNSLILTISPQADGVGTLVSVICPRTHQVAQHPMPNHDPEKQPLDAAWISADEFVLCGGELLQAFQCTDGNIVPTRKYETRDSHALCKIAYDAPSKLLATATDTGMVEIWDQHGEMQSFNAHQGAVTALIWQPLPASIVLDDGAERLLASAGDDGAISIWNARSLAKSKCSMTMDLGVVALAFTPDGAFISGATNDRVLIWKVGEANVPRASWTRGSEPGWQTPKSTDSELVEDQHCLCWDADGHKLAYGVNSLVGQFCVLEFVQY